MAGSGRRVAVREHACGSVLHVGILAHTIEARIVAVADVFERMCNHRPYRPARGWDEAIAEIEGGRGSRYDPDVVGAFLRVARRHRTFEALTAA